MDPGWQRLGLRIRAERARKGYRTARELAVAAGLSKRTVESIETANRTSVPLGTTLAKLERALGWEDGSALRIVGGGHPRNAPDPLLERVINAWPQLTPEDQVQIAQQAESAARRR